MHAFLRPLSVGLVLATSMLATREAGAVTTNVCDFTSVAAFQLNGSAAQALGNVLRLTPNVNTEAGSAFLKASVPFPAGTSFHTYFRSMIGPDLNGADGLAFVLQSSAAGATALGATGGALGYGGIVASAEIEMDTYLNGWDPNANHVGLMLNGDETVHIATGTPLFPLANGLLTYTWVDYDGVNKTISVFVSQTATKPAVALFSHAADLNMNLGAQAFVGFTGGTGGSINDHDILAWEFSTDGVPCACEGEAACGGKTPVCGGGGLCVECAQNSDCTAPTALCDIALGACVACLTNADCSGTTPSCNAATNTCQACTTDANCSGATPACQPSGACGECSATNSSKCIAPTNVCDLTSGSCVGCDTNADCVTPGAPVCVAGNVCGCAKDSDCAKDTYCATTPIVTGTCDSGCHVVGGIDSCAAGEMCSAQDGSVGVCEAIGTSASSAASSGVGGASASSGVGGGAGGASASAGVGGASASSAGSGGAGGANVGGASASSGTGGTNAGGASTTASNGSGTATAGAGGSGAHGVGGASTNPDQNDDGVVALGSGCACGVARNQNENGLVGVLIAIAAAMARRRAKRARARSSAHALMVKEL